MTIFVHYSEPELGPSDILNKAYVNLAKKANSVSHIRRPIMCRPRYLEDMAFKICLVVIIVALAVFAWFCLASASELTASWYSVESLKKEGTWKASKGVMANGERFNETSLTCATRLFPLGSLLRVSNKNYNKKFVIVKVTDRIGKRFATKRIDLSKRAFSQIADLKQGLVPVKVEIIRLAKAR